MGFTQRQAAGKFTRDEAETFIDQLQAEVDAAAAPPGVGDPDGPPTRRAAPRPPTLPTAADRALRDVPSERLAAELQRRGWAVLEP
jgi:hypothetical protein